MSHYLFVYGTLMTGLEAHDRMESRRSRYVGQGTISGTLYDLGPHPALRLEESGTVRGEVYEILDEELIGELDVLESYHGRPEICRYARCIVPARCDGRTIAAWAYAYNPRRSLEGAVLIESGDYRDVKREAKA